MKGWNWYLSQRYRHLFLLGACVCVWLCWTCSLLLSAVSVHWYKIDIRYLKRGFDDYIWRISTPCWAIPCVACLSCSWVSIKVWHPKGSSFNGSELGKGSLNSGGVRPLNSMLFRYKTCLWVVFTLPVIKNPRCRIWHEADACKSLQGYSSVRWHPHLYWDHTNRSSALLWQC